MSPARRDACRGVLLCALVSACTVTAAHTGPTSPAQSIDVVIDTLAIAAPTSGDPALRVRVVRIRGDCIDLPCPVLYVNDGQDLEAVQLVDTLAGLRADDAIRPVLVVAIDMPPDRLGAYGLSDRAGARSTVVDSSAGPIGTHAHTYARWMIDTLVPHVDGAYNTQRVPAARAVLGWSLGAAQAFDMAWQWPEVFGRVGAFSPSLWLASDRTDAASRHRTRLAHARVHATTQRPGLRMFFAVGDAEETADRDGDGINDALDDVRELVEGGRTGDDTPRGLRQLGYRVDAAPSARAVRADVALHVVPGGRHEPASWARMLPDFLRWAYAPRAAGLQATGHVEGWQAMPSRHVAARDVDVWLPPSYAQDPARRYPVLYVHDGQNMFDAALSYTGVDWDVDGALTRLIASNRVGEAIVVAVHNTPARFAEYMPQAPIAGRDTVATGVSHVGPQPAAAIVSDAYLQFLVDELKPFIDTRYRTRPGCSDTSTMGSSMGGLISLYALARHPDVFGAAAAVSTHWPAGDGAIVDWLDRTLPPPGTHRVYFDHGTATLDAGYATYQQRMDAVMRSRGYAPGAAWTTRVFPGAEHNETAWRARVDMPLRFLLGR